MHTIPQHPHSQRLGRMSAPDQRQPLEVYYTVIEYKSIAVFCIYLITHRKIISLGMLNHLCYLLSLS